MHPEHRSDQEVPVNDELGPYLTENDLPEGRRLEIWIQSRGGRRRALCGHGAGRRSCCYLPFENPSLSSIGSSADQRSVSDPGTYECPVLSHISASGTTNDTDT